MPSKSSPINKDKKVGSPTGYTHKQIKTKLGQCTKVRAAPTRFRRRVRARVHLIRAT